MVTDAQGQVSDTIALEDEVSKGRGGRSILMHPALREALTALKDHRGDKAAADWPVIYSEREPGMTANSVKDWFHRPYSRLGMEGCSSHSGRRTFITRAAKRVSTVGASLRDVQQLAGQASLQTTTPYIEGDSEAKRKLVGLI